MPNYIPYLILTVLSITILILTIVHKRDLGIIVLFLSYSGMVYVAEFFVMIIGNCYVYYPKVLSIPYYDNVLGAIVSNLFVIPVLGVVTAVYQLKFRWFVLFAFTLTGVSWLFEWLDIYRVNWWRKGYTFFSILIFMSLAKYWMRALQVGVKWIRFLSLWMQGWAEAATVMYIMSVVFIRHYEYGFFENIFRDDIFISGIMGMFKGLIFAAGVIFFRKFRWRLLAPVFVYSIDLPLYFLGVLVVKIPFGLYTIVYIVLATLLLLWNQYAYSFFLKLKKDS
ncbi:hypothetical protein [Radiobacillus deserti]|uniref:Uncharacterized protein n=1 Tax=Radiobacillus deserti TaxID=2594883 RepID=A0A516KID4_9BACI|nr:hypothetical protein [Radiobacillus deserti]QDP41152.1 hypothetical protein FN924_13715 [Radiobacillus deserti]